MDGFAHIFLGANSGEGFASLYGQLSGTRLRDLLILKGGPGCGKSSFMRTLAKKLTAEGLRPVYVHCSGDPDSLDGVIFPEIAAGLVDGTSPHVLEPEYTGAHERYLDLMRFYDIEQAKAARGAIVAQTDAYRAAYREAYHILRALDALESERRAAIHAVMDREKLRRRTAGIIDRELRGRGAPARADRAFLGGITHKGELVRFDTVEALCPRVYALVDGCGLAAPMLEQLAEAAAAAGERTLACMSPDRPREMQHLLVPGRGLAFVTVNARMPYEGAVYRRIRVEAMTADALSRAEKARIRLTERVQRTLRADAVAALGRAKAAHDVLEAVCNPCVDFDGVYELAEREAERILGRSE